MEQVIYSCYIYQEQIGVSWWNDSYTKLSNNLYIPWLRCNNLILSWILNSISEEIVLNVLYVTSTREVLEKLKTRFAQPDNVRIYQLQQQLGSIMQGTQSISDYFTQLNAVWEELNNYRPLPHCSCGLFTCNAKKHVGETQQMDYVFKFLMGLNDTFDSIRGQIILYESYALIGQDFLVGLVKAETEAGMHTDIASPWIFSIGCHPWSNQEERKIWCYLLSLWEGWTYKRKVLRVNRIPNKFQVHQE